MCNTPCILFDFWIGERCLRLKRLMFSVYSHMFSILLICPHMFYVFYNPWLDAIASTLLFVSKCYFIFIVYIILLSPALARWYFGKYVRLTVCYLPKFSILASMFVWRFVCLSVCLFVYLSVRMNVVSRIQVVPFDQSSPNLTQMCILVIARNPFIM